ncbi:MAG: hypothetical protein ACNA8W_10930 [Bradymonadaceae bacterium]
MKIGDQPDVSVISNNLLERMRQAHEEAGAAAIGEGKALDDFTVPDPALFETVEAHAREVDRDELEARLLVLARDMLDDKYHTPTEAREAVVEMIIDEQYGPHLPPEEHDQFVETLQNALVDDPRFTTQVDQMLIHAARCLGGGDKEQACD